MHAQEGVRGSLPRKKHKRGSLGCRGQGGAHAAAMAPEWKDTCRVATTTDLIGQTPIRWSGVCFCAAQPQVLSSAGVAFVVSTLRRHSAAGLGSDARGGRDAGGSQTRPAGRRARGVGKRSCAGLVSGEYARQQRVESVRLRAGARAADRAGRLGCAGS